MTAKRLKIIMGTTIMETRTKCGISINELAELIGITSGFLGNIERGERGATPLTLFKLSKIFNVPIDHFFFKSDFKTDPHKARIYAFTYDFTESELDLVIQIAECIESYPTQKISWQENPTN